VFATARRHRHQEFINGLQRARIPLQLRSIASDSIRSVSIQRLSICSFGTGVQAACR
jgi:hypothetical protein